MAQCEVKILEDESEATPVQASVLRMIESKVIELVAGLLGDGLHSNAEAYRSPIGWSRFSMTSTVLRIVWLLLSRMVVGYIQ